MPSDSSQIPTSSREESAQAAAPHQPLRQQCNPMPGRQQKALGAVLNVDAEPVQPRRLAIQAPVRASSGLYCTGKCSQMLYCNSMHWSQTDSNFKDMLITNLLVRTKYRRRVDTFAEGRCACSTLVFITVRPCNVRSHLYHACRVIHNRQTCRLLHFRMK